MFMLFIVPIAESKKMAINRNEDQHYVKDLINTKLELFKVKFIRQTNVVIAIKASHIS